MSLMFNAAGRLKGEFPHLEGKSVKYLRFGGMPDVQACQAELAALTRAWCELKGEQRMWRRTSRRWASAIY